MCPFFAYFLVNVTCFDEICYIFSHKCCIFTCFSTYFCKNVHILSKSVAYFHRIFAYLLIFCIFSQKCCILANFWQNFTATLHILTKHVTYFHRNVADLFHIFSPTCCIFCSNLLHISLRLLHICLFVAYFYRNDTFLSKFATFPLRIFTEMLHIFHKI